MCMRQWSSGLHKQGQHMVYLELGSLTLLPTLAPTPLPQLFNMPTANVLFNAIVFSCLVSVVPTLRNRATASAPTNGLPSIDLD